MSEIEPRRHPKKDLALRHIPSEVVPVPLAEAQSFVRDAVSRTILRSPITSAFAGWAFFSPRLRFTAVDDAHTRIELDVEGNRIANIFLYPQRRAEIHRFFVALEDELVRRERWRPNLTSGSLPSGSESTMGPPALT